MTIDNERKQSIKTSALQNWHFAEHPAAVASFSKPLLNKLIRNVSDKLRSPMFVIKSYVQLLQRTQDTNRLNRGFKLMEDATLRMEKTVSALISLTDIYTQEPPKRELLFFRESCDRAMLAVYDIRQEILANIEVDFSEHTKVWFHKNYLIEVITQLLSNALLHNATKKDLQINICSYKLLNSIVLEIKDNGKGIDTTALKEKIRDPFNTQSKIKECVGIGLSKIEAIAKVNGCVFDIESKPNQGTTCRFFFR